MAALKKIRSTPSSKAEDNLLKRLASFPQLNPNPIYEVDFSGTIIYANPAARKLESDGVASMVGGNAKELVEVFRGQKDKELVREVKVGQRWYRQSIHSVPGEEVLRVYAVDITKSKQVLMYLDFQQMFLSSILEHINTAVVACNEKGELVLFNRMARDWHGLDPIKIPQKQWAEYYNLYLEDGTTPMGINSIPLVRAFRGETVHDISMVIAARGQAKRYVLANAGPVKDKDGRVSGAVAVMYDITERKLMDDALRASEERFRSVFQHSPSGVVLVACDGKYIHVNDAFQKMLGFTESELQQMTFKDATSPEDRPATVEFVRQALAGEIETFCFEKRYLRKNGDVIWGLVSSTLIRNSNNQPLHFIAQIQDITERKQMEEQIKEEKYFSEEVIQAAGEGIIVYDTKLCYKVWNPTMEQITGISAAQVLGKKARMYSRTLWNKALISYWPGRCSARRLFLPIFLIVSASHGEKRLGHRGFILRIGNNKGNIIGVIAMVREITERKKAEEILKRENSFRSAIIENQPGMVWFKDKAGKFLAVNQKFVHGCGHRNALDVIGRTDFDIWPKELAEKYRADDEQVMRTKKHFRGEELIEDGGVRKFYETFKMPVVDSSGEVLGTSGFAQDITERKQAEEDLRIAKEQAEKANKYKSAFLMNITHDLRTPLNAILGFSQMLKSVDMEEKYKKCVDFINERGQHLSAMVEDILNASKIDFGKIELKSEEFDFRGLLEDSIKVATLGSAAKDLTVSLSLEGAIPRLKGDSLRVRQVIDNLLDNAVKYTQEGQIKVTAGLDDNQPNKDQYRLRVLVQDSGIGIPEEKLPYVFEPFTRFHEFYKGQKYEGVGLGLYIVKQLVTLMGGQVSVSSQVDRGSEFIIYFNFDKV